MRFVRFAAPSAAVALAAAAAAGLIEGAAQGAGLLAIACAAGAAALYVAPAGFMLALAARGLWLVWRPIVGGVNGAVLFGGVLYALLAVLALGAIGFAAHTSPAIILALSTLALLAASRPAVLGLGRIAAAAGVRSPRRAHRALAAVAVILVGAVWFGVIGPATEKIDYGYGPYGWTALAVLVVGHAWGRIRSRVLGVSAALVCFSLVAVTVAVRLSSPAALFDAWFRMPVGGLAIGFTWDIDDLRSRSMPDLAPRALPGAAHPDIALVTIDTLRADQLRLHGGAAAMPALEGVARRGVVFDWAFAPSNNTRQSVSSMMTGLSPARLRGRVVEFGLKLDPRHILVAERLRAAGYATAAFLCCNNHMGGRKKIGLDRGMETVAYDRSGTRLTELATAWLRGTSGADRPRLLWVHYFEPHDWKKQFPGERDDAKARYRRSIERTDRLLAPLLAAIEASGRPTILVIASDHGEGLGEHRALHHASDLYSTQLRVPLIIAGADIIPRRVSAPVGLLDLAPTLMELAGYEPPGMPAMDGRSFAALLRGDEHAERDVYAVMVRDRSVARSGKALIAGRHKLIAVDGRKLELYDLLADPAEARNLARRQPELAADLAERLTRRGATDSVAPF